MEIFEPLEISRAGVGIGKFRMTRRADDPPGEPIGLCEHEHGSKEEARNCPGVQSVMEANFPKREKTPSMSEAEAAVIEAAQDWATAKEGSKYGPLQSELARCETELMNAMSDLATENDGRWKSPY